jgi:regulator of RNase E activity RraA
MNQNRRDKIRSTVIEKIRKNRISSTEVADCLGKAGALPDALPLNKGHHEVGEIELVYAHNESNWGLHKQIETVPDDCILIVENHECGDKAMFGEIVTKYLILYQGVNAVAVNGKVRDASILYKEDYPVWAKGVTPIGCFNEPNDEPLDEEVISEWHDRYRGGVAVCDDGGVVVIPEEKLTEKFLKKLDFIELQEDIWSYCVDTKNWSTYRTVCEKEYIDADILPEELDDEFEEFVKTLNLNS